MRRWLLRVFVRRGLLPRDDARAMAQWAHGGGFSVVGSVRIKAADRAGRERLLRYCARPPFALDRMREFDREHLIYDPPKPGPGGSGPQCLTPLELLDRLAALVPPPRLHRHRYFGVLAPNSPLRPAVTALALAATTSPPEPNPQPAAEPAYRRAARYAWVLLLARIYEFFPLVCPRCGAEMQIIALITDGPTVRDILVHLGAPNTPPTVAPARGPPLWEWPPAGQREIDPRGPASTGLRVRSARRLVVNRDRPSSVRHDGRARERVRAGLMADDWFGQLRRQLDGIYDNAVLRTPDGG